MKPRCDIKGSKRPCSTPGCPHDTQTEDPRCRSCREGRVAHIGEEREPEPITEPCRAGNCDRVPRAWGYCDTHYRQLRRCGRVGRIQAYQRSTITTEAA